ncbi:SUMF1/EgtB/PvdO family nonheme iron enzyme [Candidatus Uabimicrobium sp. HlEnr_7]|uniref:SUMF1/EgtB/PvdO family nonheme iron enzyme n=1 Tax=Candidatus Uabimicrobium helgolandensis TaxID=3095367 RepID=UPI003555C13E
MTQIFISYRQSDSMDNVGRIHDRLVSQFGRDQIFRDSFSIPAGVHFVDFLKEKLRNSSLVLVVIGKQWLKAKDNNGNVRIFNNEDIVRAEISIALENNIPIIPLLVQNAEMPKESELPENISQLTYQNGIRIRQDPDFDRDIENLISTAKNILQLANFKFSQECTVNGNIIKEYTHIPTGIEFVQIPSGRFAMGSSTKDDMAFDSEKYRREVTIDSFLMSKYAITQDIWKKIMGKNPSSFQSDKAPVEQVSWEMSQEFCSNTGLKLPSETQWEYACRANTKDRFYWGEQINSDYCWYKDNSQERLQEVGQKLPNNFGLHDMLGNLWEWCEDSWTKNYEECPTDGSPYRDSTKNSKVLRGGSFWNSAKRCRCSSRGNEKVNTLSNRIGFRVIFSC